MLPNPVHSRNGALRPPNGWDEYGLGDSFEVHATCNALGQYVTGMHFWLEETNAALASLALDTVDMRIQVFHASSHFLVLDWFGACTARSYLGLLGMHQVECDFTNPNNGGVFLQPQVLPCGALPSLPTGQYELVFTQRTSPSLGWLPTFPNTGCHQASFSRCAFSQRVGGDYATDRMDFCPNTNTGAVDRTRENMSFRILGSKTAPIIQC